jgi:protease-4
VTRRNALLALAALLLLAALPWGLRRLPGRLGEAARSLSPQKDRIAVLPFYGEITDSDWAVRWLKRFGYDVRGVKAIVLAMDTPGGGVAPSQEINQAIWRLREDGVVVVASMGSLAASGGYYVAAACDEIVANPGTVTGSIGVLMETVDLQGLLGKLGASFETVKSGEFKDAGNFTRPLGARERALFQGAIDDVHQQFVEAVFDGRREALAQALAHSRGGEAAAYSDAQVKAYAARLSDGRIFTGRQAQELGLVDRLGGLEDAIDRAAELAGLEDPQVITYREPRSLAQWMTGLSKQELRAWVRDSVLGSGTRLNYLLR